MMQNIRFYFLLWILAFLPKSIYAQAYPAGACTPVPYSKTCIDTTPCKTDVSGIQVCLSGVAAPAGAVTVPQTCWKYSYQYACKSASSTNTCSAYENNSKCAILSTNCMDKDPVTGACDAWNYTYQCKTKEATTEQQLQCTSGLLTPLPTPSNPNNTFGSAAVAMEVGREMTVYANGAQSAIFSGVKETCSKGYAGIKNCCKSSPGAQTNANVVQSLGMAAAYSAVKYAGQVAVDTVSPYVFDAMFSSGLFSNGMMTSMTSSTIMLESGGGQLATTYAANGMTFGAYGFTYGTGTFQAANAMSGTTVLSEGFTASGSGYIAFNPYMLAASIALQYVMSLMSCTQEEQLLAMHKGANLSVYVGTECSNSVLGVCLEYTDTYCSFNSILARIINKQGKAQLGLNFSSCSGLTIPQVTAIDFTKIDFSEFAGAMQQQAMKGIPSTQNISKAYQPIMSNTTSGSGQSSAYGTAYPSAP